MGICWLSVAKNLNFWQILTFGGSCTAPFYRRGPDLVCCCRPMVYAYVPKFVSIGLFCRPLVAKNANFAGFWTSAFSGVANWHQSEKVEHWCTAINLPLSNGIKVISVVQCLHGEIRCTNSDVQKRDRQTDRQTKRNSTFLAALAAGEIRAQPNLA